MNLLLTPPRRMYGHDERGTVRVKVGKWFRRKRLKERIEGTHDEGLRYAGPLIRVDGGRAQWIRDDHE